MCMCMCIHICICMGASASRNESKSKSDSDSTNISLNSELNDVCHRHSLMQAQYNRMTHDRYDHSPMDKAINEHGLKWTQYGENVARGQQSEEIVMNVWMHSPPHRRNILNPTFTHMGAALAQPGNYWTQGFATLPGKWNAPMCP
ncbi:hypothetical protein K7432_017078 [Basidiobolus ranarum]|uniref:SCP domain-containing protein n=1 Tax=Basidiobolus ranarum TaxID=34480 RepID=A0ABR2VLY2_9FUNG